MFDNFTTPYISFNNYCFVSETTSDIIKRLIDTNGKHIVELRYEDLIDYLILAKYIIHNNLNSEAVAVVYDLLRFSYKKRELVNKTIQRIKENELNETISYTTTTGNNFNFNMLK